MEALFQFCSEQINTGRVPACFWYDYTSLPQHPRTADEEALFKAGLAHIDVLCRTTINVPLISRASEDMNASILQMLQRGWILVELMISQHNQNVYLTLFEGAGDYISFGKANRVNWQDTMPSILADLPYYDPLLIRQWFDVNHVACTNNADLDFVAGLLYAHLCGYIVKDYPAPAPLLPFHQTGEFDATQLAPYFINSFGYSPFFPDVYFDVTNVLGKQAYRVTAVERPSLPRLNEWTNLTENQFKQLQIEPATKSSKLYPGIRFEVQQGLNDFSVKPFICTVDWGKL